MISEIEEYFLKGCGRCERFATPDCSTLRWVGGLKDLRQTCVEARLEEVVKRGRPCYMHAERNIVVLGAFRSDFRMSFFNAALMKDPERVLEKQGPNTCHPDMIRFTERALVAEMEPTIRVYLQEAMSYAEAGIKPPKEEGEIELPDQLVDALDAAPERAEAFHKLTRGRKKSYVINLGPAKRPETRVLRISKFRKKILEGRGATERKHWS